jgi:hypothetical protein
VRHQLKWRAKSAGDPKISSSDPTIEEDVTRLIDRDRAKAAAWKGKEDSNSQSKFFTAVGGMMSTLKKLITSFAKAQLRK